MLNKRDRKIYDFIVSKELDGVTLKEIKDSLKLDKPFNRSILKLKKAGLIIRTIILRDGEKIHIPVSLMLKYQAKYWEDQKSNKESTND